MNHLTLSKFISGYKMPTVKVDVRWAKRTIVSDLSNALPHMIARKSPNALPKQMT